MKFSSVVSIQSFGIKNANPSFYKKYVENGYFPLLSKFQIGSLRQRAEKWREMNLRGWAWKGSMRFRIYVGMPKSKFIPKPSGKYRWLGILTYH
jgi:hypothetical protein